MESGPESKQEKEHDLGEEFHIPQQRSLGYAMLFFVVIVIGLTVWKWPVEKVRKKSLREQLLLACGLHPKADLPRSAPTKLRFLVMPTPRSEQEGLKTKSFNADVRAQAFPAPKALLHWLSNTLGKVDTSSVVIRESRRVLPLFGGNKAESMVRKLLGFCRVDAIIWMGARPRSKRGRGSRGDDPKVRWFVKVHLAKPAWRVSLSPSQHVSLPIVGRTALTDRGLRHKAMKRLHHWCRGLLRLHQANRAVSAPELSLALHRMAMHSFALAKLSTLAQYEAHFEKSTRTNVLKHMKTMRPSRMVLVPAGAFWWQQRDKQKPSEWTWEKQELPTFWIDRTEVSRSDYARCVVAGRCSVIKGYLKAPWHLPRDRVTVEQAASFCAFEGKRLPTEQEWVKAARGGLEISKLEANTQALRKNPEPKRTYPWGQQKGVCAQRNSAWCYLKKYEASGQKLPTMIAVHHRLKGSSPYGVWHMVGNAAELVQKGTIKGGSGFSPVRGIGWHGQMDRREGLSWVGFRCAKTHTGK